MELWRNQGSDCLDIYIWFVTDGTRSANTRNTRLVTGWIRGTSPGSRKAYAAPLNVVPISRAMMSFREEPE